MLIKIYHSFANKKINNTIETGYDRNKIIQILDETDCILHSTNTLGKGMNPIILPPAMGK